MKKLIFLFAILLTMITVSNAQMLTSYGSDGQTYFSVATDYTLTNTTARYWEVVTAVPFPASQYVVINCDSATGNHTNVAIALYGRVSDIEGWTQIGSTVNWKGTTHDTTIAIANTTENRYRRYKLLFTGTGIGTTTISSMELKLHSPD